MQLVLDEISRHLPVGTESKRLFHGRGHCFPGYENLLLDWYRPVVLISLYAPRNQEWLKKLVDWLHSALPEMRTVLVQERYVDNSPVKLLAGQEPQTVEVVEAGLHYRLRIGRAQNVGFFPDMCRGRRLVREIATGKKVLNLFAYSCSFSVAALAGGAEQVVNLDMNAGALELGRLNHELNQLDLRKASFMPLELFKSMSKLKKLAPFDLLICDPPAYQGKSFKAERDWPKLLRKLPDLIAPTADVIACLNGPHLPPDFLLDLFETIRPELELQDSLQPGDNFPEANADRGVWIFHYRQRSG